MPRRTDLNHVLVIGSGPIVIGQACEFDYSGTQACRVLRAEGLTVSLVNSNPATIMTDPEYADNTYVEPITAEFVEKVMAQQAARGTPIDALLATLGGQTALNTAVALYENGALDRYDVELIGRSSRTSSRRSEANPPVAPCVTPWRRCAKPSRSWGYRSWCGRRSRWVDSGPEWRSRSRTLNGWPGRGSRPRRRRTC